MAKGDSQKYQGDKRDSGRKGIEASIESIASSRHPGHNEDSALADVGRLQAEIANPPVKDEAMKELIRDLGQKELANVDKLKERNVYGVLDGVSTAGGLIASRVASEKISEIMSHMPKDASAERARRSIEAAMGSAHEAIRDLMSERPEIGKIGTTADIAVPIDNGDGTYDVAYGHSGDSRIYVLDGETGEIRCETIDDGFAGEALRKGDITREEYDQVMNHEPVRNQKGEVTNPLPGALNFYYSQRNVISRSLGHTPEFSTGTFKVKKGDKMLISSDGIHDNLTAEKIAEIMRQGGGVKELAKAAYDIASSGDGRAKPDDITGTVVEFGGKGKEARAASQESAGRPTAEQLQQWRQEMSQAAAQIGSLTRLEKLAGKDRIDPQDMVTVQDLQAIQDMGKEGITALKREWQLYSLDRKKALLQQQIGEKALQDISNAEKDHQRLLDLHKGAVIAEQKANGMPESPLRPSFEIQRQIDAMIKRGEDPTTLRERIAQDMVTARNALKNLEASMPQAVELKMAQADYDRLLAEKMRAEKLKADAEKAAEEEKIRQQLETPTAPPRTTPSAQQGPRMARVMPAVNVPDQRPREASPFLDSAEVAKAVKAAEEKKKKDEPKKKGFWGKLFGKE